MVSQILIVDDDEEDRELFIDVVSRIAPSVTCREACDGEDALALLTGTSLLPDLIFLDLNMPRIGGIEFLKQVKKDARLKDIPVVIYTTSKRTEAKREALRLGAVYFISKPYQLSDREKEISFVLEKEWRLVPEKKK